MTPHRKVRVSHYPQNLMRKRMAAACLGTLLFVGGAALPAADRPNIVFILADDLGWADLGIYGSTFYETPNLDRLARQGMRFTHAYAASNVCSPTRASILAGKYPVRLGITDWLNGRPDRPDQKLLRPALQTHLPLAEVTFAEALKEAGYRTAFIGKWHLGEAAEHFPEHQGFDINVAGYGKGSPPSYFSPYRIPNLADGPTGESLTDRLTTEALTFMEAAVEKREPFLVYLSHYAVHNPMQAKAETIAKYRNKLARNTVPAGPEFVTDLGRQVRQVQSHATYAAMVESLDDSVGRVMEKLVQLGVDDTTIIVFTSDNGGLSTAEGSPTSNLPLRAGKGWAYEGGVREPLIIRWPGTTPSASISTAPVISTDFYPTLLEMAGQAPRPDQHLDGTSLVPALRGGDLAERPLYWHYPHYSNQGGRPHGAVRLGDFKLIEWYEDLSVELYHLTDDPGEQRDLAAILPDQAARLRDRLHDWRAEVGARMPSVNPNYRPSTP